MLKILSVALALSLTGSLQAQDCFSCGRGIGTGNPLYGHGHVVGTGFYGYGHEWGGKGYCPPYRYTTTGRGRPVEWREVGQCIVWFFKGTNERVPDGGLINLRGTPAPAQQLAMRREFRSSTYVLRNGAKVHEGIPGRFSFQNGDIYVQQGRETYAHVIGTSTRFYESKKDYLSALDKTKQATQLASIK